MTRIPFYCMYDSLDAYDVDKYCHVALKYKGRHIVCPFYYLDKINSRLSVKFVPKNASNK